MTLEERREMLDELFRDTRRKSCARSTEPYEAKDYKEDHHDPAKRG